LLISSIYECCVPLCETEYQIIGKVTIQYDFIKQKHFTLKQQLVLLRKLKLHIKWFSDYCSL